MPMWIAIITGVFTIIGAIAGAIVTALIEKDKQREQRIHNSLSRCANQIKAYFYLEKAYMETIHGLTGDLAQTFRPVYDEKLY